MAFDLEMSNSRQAGTWSKLRTRNGKLSAVMFCPGCGRTILLARYNIYQNGLVIPSVFCPYSCGFHNFIVLSGWTENANKTDEEEGQEEENDTESDC